MCDHCVDVFRINENKEKKVAGPSVQIFLFRTVFFVCSKKKMYNESQDLAYACYL